MSKEKVDVEIDSREPSDRIEVIVMHEEVNDFEIHEMEVGDIKIGDCVFEVKESSDFAASVSDGRLRDQVERLAEQSGDSMRPFILVEGNMDDFDSLNNGPPAKSLRGMAASIIARNNIPVVFCSKPGFVIDMAVRIARKTIENPSNVQTNTTGTSPDTNFMEDFFGIIDGVGPKTASNLANKFTSIEMALSASEEELCKSEGIGEKRAGKIIDTLNDEHGTTEEETQPSRTVISI